MQEANNEYLTSVAKTQMPAIEPANPAAKANALRTYVPLTHLTINCLAWSVCWTFPCTSLLASEIAINWLIPCIIICV
jgi:hypothetical protein